MRQQQEISSIRSAFGSVRLRDSRYGSARIEAKKMFKESSPVHIFRLRRQSGSFCMTATQVREHAIVDKLVRLTAFSSSLSTVGRKCFIKAEILQLRSVCMAYR